MSARHHESYPRLPTSTFVPDQDRLHHIKRIFDLVPNALLLLDQAGNIAACNTAALAFFGYSEHELVGRDVDFIWQATATDRHAKPHVAACSELLTGIARPKNGEIFPAALSFVADTAAIAPFTSAMLQKLPRESDSVHQVRQLQAELAHMARVTELGEMAATLAHELTQPLAAIANYSQGCTRLMATTGDTSSTQVQEVLSEITRHALRAGDIINRLRDFVARTAGDKSVEHVHQLIDEAMEITLLGTGSSRLSTEYLLEAKRDRVLVDRIQIEQVVMNLVRNAVEAMEGAQRRNLRISTKNGTDDTIVVEISDTGAGIEWDETLFHPFVSNKPRGIGVGLAMSKRIIEAHGGNISARPGAGVGSIFSFTLPLLERPDAK